MDSDQKRKVAETVFKGGVGFISSLSEQTAKGINDPKAMEITRNITDSLKQVDSTAKKGAELGEWIVRGGVTTAIATVTSSTGVLATASAFLPAVAVIGVGGLGLYGLYHVCKGILDD
ncbi:MAG: hypothetical protein JHC73_09400 [Dolichospermum sp.]|nr:hypothetical protein [Dolichospermum sp.]